MDLSSRFSGNGNGNGCGNGNGQAAVVEEVLPGTVRPEAAETLGEAKVSGESEGKEGRDQAGRFAAGNKGGPGNPYSRHVANLKVWLAEVVDQEGMQRIGRKLAELAEGGNVAAARLLFQYVMPRKVEPDRMNIEEWQLLKEDGSIFSELPGMMTKPGAELALRMTREARPAMTEKMGMMMSGMLSTPQEKIGDVMSILGGDPRVAREYLDGLADGKGGKREEERGKSKGKVKPVKR